MANHKSAAKRARQTLRITARNRMTRSAVRSQEKKVVEAIAKKDTDSANKLLPALAKAMDQAAQKGIIHFKRASRRISRISKQISALK